MPANTAPASLRLAGRFVVADGGGEGIIETARRIDYPDGRVAFIAEYEDAEEQWELRIESTDGRNFKGRMSSREWETAYRVTMELWVAPDDAHEWLLLGCWTDDEEGETEWSINLYVEEADEDADA